MKKRKLGCLCLGVMLVLSTLTGCSMTEMPDFSSLLFWQKPTAESVLNKSAKAMSGLESYSLIMNADYDVTIGADENGSSFSMDMSIKMDDLTVDVVKDGDDITAGHAEGNVSVGMLGMNVSVPMEMYLEANDDGTYEIYQSEDGSSWTQETSEKSADEAMFYANILTQVSDVDGDAWTLSKDTMTVKNTEVYELSVRVNGSDMEDVISIDTSGIFENFGISDFDFPDMQVTQYIDAEDYDIVQVTIGFADDLEESDRTIKADDSTIIFNAFAFDITYDKFNALDLEDVQVPDDVKKAAKAGVDTDDSDSFLTDILETEGVDVGDNDEWSLDDSVNSSTENSFTEDGYTVTFTQSNGYELYTSDNYIGVYSEDGKYDLSAYIITYFDGKDTVTEEQESTNSYYNSEVDDGSMKDIYISDVQATTLGSYKVYWYSHQYTDATLSSAFVSKTYEFYVDLGNEKACVISMSEISDVGSQVTLTDDVAKTMLGYFNIAGK